MGAWSTFEGGRAGNSPLVSSFSNSCTFERTFLVGQEEIQNKVQIDIDLIGILESLERHIWVPSWRW